METRGTKKGQPSLYPYIAGQARRLFDEEILDFLSVWVCEDVVLLRDQLEGDLSHVARRFEISTIPPPERWWLWAAARAMSSLGLGLLIIDEATNVEPDHWGLMGEFVTEFGD